MPTMVTRYRCDLCGSLFESESAAISCESNPVSGDEFRLGERLLRGNDVFTIVDRHVRRMGKTNGANFHLAFYEISGPYTWQGKPRLTSARHLRQLGLRPPPA